MIRYFFSLTLAATLLTAASCQKSAEGAGATGDATVISNSPEDTGDGLPNSAATPDTLPGATATADAADVAKAQTTAPAGGADKTATDPAAFLLKAASGGMMEVEAAKVAQKSADPTVKNVAEMILKDHTQANEQIKALAARNEVKLPPAPIDEAKTTLDKLMAVSGKEFDKLYLEEMNLAHEKDVAMFEAHSKNGTNSTVRAFAAKTLPVLKAHAEMLKKHQKMM